LGNDLCTYTTLVIGEKYGMQVGGTVYSGGDDVILTLQLKWEGGTQ